MGDNGKHKVQTNPLELELGISQSIFLQYLYCLPFLRGPCQNLLIYQLQGNIYRCLIHHETSVILFIINKQVLKCWKEWVIGSFKFSIVSAHLQMFANFSHMQCILDNIFATVNCCGEFNGNLISASNKSTVDNLSTFFIA